MQGNGELIKKLYYDQKVTKKYKMGKKHCRVREGQEKSDNIFFPFLDDKSENALKHFFPAQSLKK